MKTMILATALIAAAGFGSAAFAQTTTDVSATATARQTTTTTNTPVALGTKQVPVPGSRNCLQDTGSHIKRRDQVCLPVNGNSYSREDIERTGDPNIGQALQSLDPSLQVHHGH